jgi:hypothetical protein
MASKRSHTEVEKAAEAAPAKKSLVRTPLDEALEEALFENSKAVGLPYIPYDVQGIIKQMAGPTPLEEAADTLIEELVDPSKKLTPLCDEALRQMFDQVATTDGGTRVVGRREWIALSASTGIDIRVGSRDDRITNNIFGARGLMDENQFVAYFATNVHISCKRKVMHRKLKVQAALFVKKFQS